MSAATRELELGGVPFALRTGDDGWTVTLRRSLVRVQDEAALDPITHDHDGLMPCRVTWQHESVTLELTPGPGTVGWDALARRPRADRLRALINVGVTTARLLAQGYALLLHPENLVVDRNLRPLLAYRGLREAMPPDDFDGAHLLRQYQALALVTFDPQASFSELVDGALTLRRATAFERSVLAATEVEQLVAYLVEQYDTTAADDAERLVRVGRRSYRALRYAVVWLGVLAVATGGLSAYHVFVRAPLDERLLAADTRFVRSDHEGVIETLRPIAVADLPTTQRYELASSYLRGTNLSEEQKAAVANTISLRSDTEVLTYWVQIGRGHLDDALDTAKGLNDIDLVLYALTLLEEQAASDTTLPGAERQERVDELRAEYDGYLEKRSAAIEQGTATTGTATTGPTAEPVVEPATDRTAG
ncbi:MAG TPA: type VII secretion protein EssB [Friedmanniella sp.]